MPTDAIILEHAESEVLGSPMRSIIRLAPVPNGRSYVILAKGSVFASNSKATLQLEAFGATDSVEVTFSGDQGETSFVLAVATTLPDDDEFFSVAELSAGSQPFSGGPATGLATVTNAKLVVLAVHSVAVQLV